MDKFECVLCPELVDARTQIVYGHGPIPAKVMFVGEAPGPQEDELGIPFIGPAGEELNKWLEELGLKRDEVFITNAVLCFPNLVHRVVGTLDDFEPKGTFRRPTLEELQNCNTHLIDQIAEVHPKVLIPLGRTAEKACNTLVVQQWIEENGCELFPLPHPSYIRRWGKSVKMELSILKHVLERV